MENKDIYKSPMSDLGIPSDYESKKYGVWKRFYLTFFWAVPVYILITTTTTPKEVWVFGVIGSIMFSVISGLMGALIPVQRKSVFITAGILIGIIGAAMIGSNMV